MRDLLHGDRGGGTGGVRSCVVFLEKKEMQIVPKGKSSSTAEIIHKDLEKLKLTRGLVGKQVTKRRNSSEQKRPKKETLEALTKEAAARKM